MESMSLEQLLAGYEFFGALGPADLALIAGCGRNEHFDTGSFLFRQGQQADRFYLVRAGRVALEIEAPGRGSLVIDTVETGGVVGVSWIFPPYRWQFDARASEPVRAVGFDAACLRQKADDDPRLGYELMKSFAGVLAQRMQSARIRLLDLYSDVRTG
jgi:CRP-like cAMP-binding protein